jgi:hypothetical protein
LLIIQKANSNIFVRRDIIDTERSSGDVNKTLLGSFIAEFDEKEDDDGFFIFGGSPTHQNFEGGADPVGGPQRISTFRPESSFVEQNPSTSIIFSSPARTPTSVGVVNSSMPNGSVNYPSQGRGLA